MSMIISVTNAIRNPMKLIFFENRLPKKYGKKKKTITKANVLEHLEQTTHEGR
jgi:hypothetical protein